MQYSISGPEFGKAVGAIFGVVFGVILICCIIMCILCCVGTYYMCQPVRRTPHSTVATATFDPSGTITTYPALPPQPTAQGFNNQPPQGEYPTQVLFPQFGSLSHPPLQDPDPAAPPESYPTHPPQP